MAFHNAIHRAAAQCPCGDPVDQIAKSSRGTLHLVVSGTRIATPQGEVEADRIAAGDLVVSRVHGPVVVEHADFIPMPRPSLIANPRLTPVAIPAGALGAGLPARVIWLHPQSPVLTGAPGKTARRACDLVGDAGVARIFPESVTYVALHLPVEAELQMAGIWVGPQRQPMKPDRTVSPDSAGWQQIGQIATRWTHLAR